MRINGGAQGEWGGGRNVGMVNSDTRDQRLHEGIVEEKGRLRAVGGGSIYRAGSWKEHGGSGFARRAAKLGDVGATVTEGPVVPCWKAIRGGSGVQPMAARRPRFIHKQSLVRVHGVDAVASPACLRNAALVLQQSTDGVSQQVA